MVIQILSLLGGFFVLISPLYWGLYKINGRLTKVETQVGFLFEKNGGKN